MIRNVCYSFLIICLCTACKNQHTTMNIEYSREDILKDAYIVRDKDTKSAFLHINKQEEWKLYAGSSVETIELSTPIAEGSDTGVFQLPVSDSTRTYFLLSTNRGQAILAEKHLPMQGGFNFRDLGGIKTKDGRRVKWGKLFRGDELCLLTDADLNYLSSIPLISIVDFRSEEEIEGAPDKNPTSVKKNYPLSISPGNMSAMWKSIHENAISADMIDSLMKELYILLVNDSISIKRYKEFFALLQDSSQIPLLFHCTAGKDRTGMGTALLLFALGVDEQSIIDDYLLSNVYLDAKYAPLKALYPAIATAFEVKAEFISAGLQKIKEEHGTIENYLEKVLEVDIAKLQKMYLE